jgi:hypothetical protein
VTAEGDSGTRSRFEALLRAFAKLRLERARTLNLLLSAGFPADWIRAAFPLAPREVLRDQIREQLIPFTLEIQGSALVLDRLLACKEFWNVLQHEPLLDPVRVARDLLVWEVVYRQQVGGSPKALAALRAHEKPRRAECDKDIKWLSQLATRRPKDDVRVLVEELIKCIQRDRDAVPIDPELIATKGLAARDHQAHATATVHKHLGKLVPKTCPDRASAVKALAMALGVQFTRYSYRDHVRRYD